VSEVSTADLLRRAIAWRDADPDPRTRAEIERLVDRVNGRAGSDGGRTALADLADRFDGSLQFGTAGLRGEVAAGPNRMNRAVVIRAAAGLARYLLDTLPDHPDGPPAVVVGYDARHGSAVFARDTAAVMTAAGCRVLLLPGPLPTPVLAFALRRLSADAGVMVTASHNPPRDNGYKVYLGGRAEPGPGQGAQIVPPADAAIARRIAAASKAVEVPLAANGWTTLGEDVLEAYLATATGVLEPGGPRALGLVVTPLHGVGGAVLERALAAGGFAAPYVVPEQAAPDPDFPTVAFPNPEEPGAIDLAVAAAAARRADLVIANDPDADRCAVAVPLAAADRSTSAGWRMLRGDEVGALLGEYLLSRRTNRATDRVACSIVSSELLARIATAHGVRHESTLTGFKWLSRVPDLVFAYEEALGYCVAPDSVRDKDGVTAALLVAELAAGLRRQGCTLLDALDDLALAHGVHATDQLSVRVDDVALIGRAMERWRAHPPDRLAGAQVSSVEDLEHPADGMPPTDGLRWRTADGVRVVVRPSGTEPKLKCYLEAVVPVPDGPDPAAGLAQARALAADRLARTRADLSADLTTLTTA
jgi:phosphomannomutase